MFLGLALTFPLRLGVWGGAVLRRFIRCWRRAPLGPGLAGAGPAPSGTSLILEAEVHAGRAVLLLAVFLLQQFSAEECAEGLLTDKA